MDDFFKCDYIFHVLLLHGVSILVQPAVQLSYTLPCIPSFDSSVVFTEIRSPFIR